MDEADLSEERSARELAALLRQRRRQAPAACGHCLWCDAPLSAGQRWCDTDCRDDWERTHERRQRPR